MGVGTPVDLLAGIALGHRHVRLRDAHAQRAQRPAVHRAAASSTSATPSTAPTTARSKRAALRVLRDATAAPIWRTCSAPRSCSTTGWRRCTTCGTTWTSREARASRSWKVASRRTGARTWALRRSIPTHGGRRQPAGVLSSRASLGRSATSRCHVRAVGARCALGVMLCACLLQSQGGLRSRRSNSRRSNSRGSNGRR